ncbi:plasmid stabilization system (plasmid) [Methanohalobium evestigatum Z-7303]|uniref:Plasmid stabilization system n=1 Tax=Methanohalobium evestigatum (strain ATCC BAA-1072 / DSM 3721 / NBRC 107634 / OCM 161 / Z-7303) TaxID=644295 RepID=D7EC45_METEZ|nr:type II toxin-antitoxin system RelE/ParE family toxin [Methanohalobium evestigatum]ADI75167.1 plasmid stabilization system [Methanohalobium evestigatum Z-7303]
MSYEVTYTTKARKNLKKLPEEIARNIIYSIDELRHNPYYSVKKISGTGKHSIYSHRVGQYRVILTIENNEMVIMVLELGDRKHIYRKYQS